MQAVVGSSMMPGYGGINGLPVIRGRVSVTSIKFLYQLDDSCLLTLGSVGHAATMFVATPIIMDSHNHNYHYRHYFYTVARKYHPLSVNTARILKCKYWKELPGCEAPLKCSYMPHTCTCTCIAASSTLIFFCLMLQVSVGMA